jgi:hypothetical protein
MRSSDAVEPVTCFGVRSANKGGVVGKGNIGTASMTQEPLSVTLASSQTYLGSCRESRSRVVAAESVIVEP